MLLTVADWRRPRCSAWLLAWSGLLATALVFAPPYPNVLRFYWPYAPLLLALVCGSGLDAGARWAGTRVPARWATWAAWAPAALGVAVLLAFSLFALRRPGATTAPLPPARGRPPEIGWLADRTPPDALVASDVSYAVAWQARRPSVRFAGRLGVIAAIDERIDRIDVFYLSPANARAAAPLREPPLSDLFAAAPAVRGVLFLRRP